jgi:hypothetical protein
MRRDANEVKKVKAPRHSPLAWCVVSSEELRGTGFVIHSLQPDADVIFPDKRLTIPDF